MVRFEFILHGLFSILLTVTGYLLHNRMSEIGEQLKELSGSLRAIQLDQSLVKERLSLIEFRVSTLERAGSQAKGTSNPAP